MNLRGNNRHNLREIVIPEIVRPQWSESIEVDGGTVSWSQCVADAEDAPSNVARGAVNYALTFVELAEKSIADGTNLTKDVVEDLFFNQADDGDIGGFGQAASLGILRFWTRYDQVIHFLIS